MRYFLLIAVLFLLSCKLLAQADSTDATLSAPEENISGASQQAKNIVIDLSDPNEVDLALKKIHTFKYLESITLQGETDESTLQKVIYRLSVLKNLSALTLKDNELNKVPDNIKTLKTLRSVSVEDNTGLDYNDLCTKLGELPLTELHLTDNDLKKNPPNFSAIKSLKKIQITGSDQLNYENLVDELAKIPTLTDLSIPVNYITDLPKNITKLKSLQVLDVSNNALTDLPSEVSSLKAINNLSIQGNLLLNPVKDLEKFKGNDILYLSLDKEMTGEEVEQIKKMFPKAEINFPPEDKNDNDSTSNTASKNAAAPGKNTYTGELKAKKEASILSTAYLSYPALFQSIVYNFDTLTLEERYLDLKYSNVYQRVNNSSWNGGALKFRKTCFDYEKAGKKNETWFRFYLDAPASANYPELRAFQGMYWVYEGELTKKQFRKRFLSKWQHLYTGWNTWFRLPKRCSIHWNDIRIQYDNNNSLFTMQLKCDTGFVKFNVYPVMPDMPIEKCQQQYNRRFLLYQKALLRRSQTFKKNLLGEKRKYDSNYRKMQDYAWKELQSRMSDEEKLMSREEWLDYYDNIVANEQAALSKTPPAKGYVSRMLALKKYVSQSWQIRPGQPGVIRKVNSVYGYKVSSVDFVDENGLGTLAVANIWVIDNKNKEYTQIQGTLGLAPNLIMFEQFSSWCIIVELRNGNFGIVTPQEIDKPGTLITTRQLKTKIIDKNFGTIGELLQGSGIN